MRPILAFCRCRPRHRILAAVVLPVVLLAGAGEARADKAKYTLRVTMTGNQQVVSTNTRDVLYPDAWSTVTRSTSYLARSTRAFWVRRVPGSRRFRFRTRVSGRLSHAGGGVFGSASGPERWFYDEWIDPRVSGAVTSSSKDSRAALLSISPKFTAAEVRRHWSDGSVVTGSGIWFPQRTAVKGLRLDKRLGRPFAITRHVSMALDLPDKKQTGGVTWTLHFVPVRTKTSRKPDVVRQRWQIDVLGRDRWDGTGVTGLRGGTDLRWRHRTRLSLEDGKIASARGSVSVLGAEPFSEPAGAFDVTAKPRRPLAAYYVRASKVGDRVRLLPWKVGRSEYRVDFTVRAAGRHVLDKLRAANHPGAAQYADLLGKPAGTDTLAADIVPDSKPLSFILRDRIWTRRTEKFAAWLPCPKTISDQECFLHRGGEQVIVRRTR